MDDNTNLMNAEATTHERLKVFAAQIVVSRNNPDKPVYGIIYYDVERKEWCHGFSSYDLKFVQQWFREELEVIAMDFEPVRHGRWMTFKEYAKKIGADPSGYVDTGIWFFCSECEQQMRFGNWAYCPNCGAKMR